MKENKTLDNLSKWLIGIVIILVLFALLSPLIFTQSGVFDFSETGQIGDTIGGIMNPFIGIASIIVMFLAFYMQYKANKIMQFQFEKSQFENQFFEMLKTHKENSNTISSTHQESEEGIGFGEESARRLWLETRKKGFEFLVDRINEKYNSEKKKNKSRDSKEIFDNVYSKYWEDNFGHYFRHLFLIVKFIVTKPDTFLTYEDKRNYLRILRASLTTFEQVFLYYNWLSDYGNQWENDTNHFFTDFRMIHNVNDSIHNDFAIKNTQPFSDLLKEKKYLTEKDRKDDKLFELIN